MDDCLRRYDISGIVTTNYDVLVEQLLGVRPCVASPGFNYGGIECAYHPPNSPFPRERAFRGGGAAAIIPPLPEKEVPPWLEPVWQEAFETLSQADAWIVIGYSLPDYDFEVRRLFSAAYRGQEIEIWDPSARRVADAFAGVAPGASFDLRSGLIVDQHDPFGPRRRHPRPRFAGVGHRAGWAPPAETAGFSRPDERSGYPVSLKP